MATAVGLRRLNLPERAGRRALRRWVQLPLQQQAQSLEAAQEQGGA